MRKFNVVGYTCMEKDYLAIDYEGEIPKPGDFLIFSNVGAIQLFLILLLLKKDLLLSLKREISLS